MRFTSWLGTLGAAILALGAAGAEGRECTKTDECAAVKRRLLFLVDASLSIGDKEFNTNMMDLLVNTYCGLTAVGAETEVGIVVFSRYIETRLPFTKMSADDFESFVDTSLRHNVTTQCCTTHAEATILATEMFADPKLDDGFENIAFFVTDGLPRMNNDISDDPRAMQFYESRGLDVETWTNGRSSKSKNVHYKAVLFPLAVEKLINNGNRLFFVGVPSKTSNTINVNYFKGKEKKVCAGGRHCEKLAFSPLVSEPANEHAYRAAKWDLEDIVGGMFKLLCRPWVPPPTPQTPTPDPTALPTVSPTMTPPPTFGRPPTISNPLCGSTQRDLFPTVTDVCEKVVLGEFDQCCQALSPLLEEPRCREHVTGEPWCVPGVSPMNCSDLGSEQKLRISIESSSPNSDSCCKQCQAYGDPECVSFEGKRVDWVLCDARNDKCMQQEDICVSRNDHTGNACLWNSDTAKKIRGGNFATYGSPCTPDFSESRPEMKLYSAPGFEATLAMDERGTIDSITLDTAEGTYTLQANLCVDNQKDDVAAWGGQPIPDTFILKDSIYYKESRSTEVLWQVTDSNTGIIVEIVCIQAVSTSGKKDKARLNIRNLVEQDLNRRRAGGFCEESEIPEVDKSLASPWDPEIMFACGESDPEVVCKLIAQPSCTLDEVLSYAEEWCDEIFPIRSRAKLCREHMGRGDIPGMLRHYFCVNLHERGVYNNVGTCKMQLKTNATAFIKEFGFAQPITECALNAKDYPKRNKLQKCVSGVSVEYYVETEAKWHEVAFVPDGLPLCEGKDYIQF
eukprot:CAMPEP_0184552680 /NCGR_PEP_ID=MMETSP0199_2-20130426/29699_1 /TAXON_ID=1112570 /ORGANISM="Thraustochytrium sp., Strain LLF1b" /LENGTH=791 /DNA_ID=CAMNT_0026948231 /DNA_START=108 /DNA_END=2480 /DNA_ORIENTATION=-